MADDTLAAAADFVKSLAVDPKRRALDIAGSAAEGASFVELPGPASAGKAALERELAALLARIQQLEARAATNGATTLPETPNETVDSDFGGAGGSNEAAEMARASSPSSSTASLSTRGHKPVEPISTPDGSASDVSATAVPAAASAALPSAAGFKAAQLTDEALEGLREHVDEQDKLLDSQRQELAGVNAQLQQQKELHERTLALIEQERVATLERELWKHQKANEAFQKALREIGEILTAVARGDLSKKVRMNTVEMDPEITTFKRTINTMMDQLQVFASEVSRVAREVGTEGILGGQARIDGVDGTWKELTDNGMSHP